MTDDPFDLARLVSAQQPVWESVCSELRAGHKQSHWMWFVFPQLATLGRSSMARHYGLAGLEEARAYLAHPVLGTRLRSSCEQLLQLEQRSARDIFGMVDAKKLRSCLTLFDVAAPGDVFGQCLQRYFDGQADPLTVDQVR
ncbi:MAG: calpastatin [Ramlibacter sp.]|jgi:uncharacterized protein (DUF1810 family)|uniref:DUF1810 domain-containing protein n=1 Tax=Ramlibacter sp. TaxID=1917967 RepID=UPI002632601B|nr:DUF1810 domain-containing protein [Ramlibacter sp.]MDB5750639.1 calpastatin [Ramlibacter sp.]